MDNCNLYHDRMSLREMPPRNPKHSERWKRMIVHDKARLPSAAVQDLP